MRIFIAILMTVTLWTWAAAHQLIIYYCCSVAVDQLPKPTGGSPLYSWLFGVLHVLAANWNRAKMGVTVKPEKGSE